jgi:hypothetical protein
MRLVPELPKSVLALGLRLGPPVFEHCNAPPVPWQPLFRTLLPPPDCGRDTEGLVVSSDMTPEKVERRPLSLLFIFMPVAVRRRRNVAPLSLGIIAMAD